MGIEGPLNQKSQTEPDDDEAIFKIFKDAVEYELETQMINAVKKAIDPDYERILQDHHNPKDIAEIERLHKALAHERNERTKEVKDQRDDYVQDLLDQIADLKIALSCKDL